MVVGSEGGGYIYACIFFSVRVTSKGYGIRAIGLGLQGKEPGMVITSCVC